MAEKEGVTEETEVEERSSIYSEFAEQNAQETGLPVPVEKTGDSKEEGKPAETATEDAGGKKAESKPETDEDKGEALKQEKQEKFVPLEALHSEREKRKAEKNLRESLEIRLRDLESQLSTQKEPEADVFVDETEALKKRVAMLEEQNAHRRQLDELNTAKEVKQRLVAQLKATNDDLSKEGYPGFEFSTGAITQELQKMVEENESNIAFDNPTGWKKIYKEKIFPALRDSIINATKETEKANKIGLKTGAGLATSPGSPVKPKDEDRVKTHEELAEEYMAMRSKRTL